MLPPRLRASAWSRLYRPTTPEYHALFEHAPLHFAPSVRMKLVPGDIVSDSIAFTGIYDLAFTRLLVRLASLGGTMVDVGANMGYFSLLWAATRRSNQVIAFEASPRVLPLLRENITGNHFTDAISIRCQAISKENGSMQFDTGSTEQLGWGGLSHEASERTQTVPVVRLDDAVGDVGEIALLKIDIEGADVWAIEGAGRILHSGKIRHVWWEENIERMRRLRIPNDGRAAELLRHAGYDVSRHGGNWHASK